MTGVLAEVTEVSASTEPGTADPAGSGSSAVRVTVRVPATSANLGPGYDCFGLALGRYDEITACRAAANRIEVAGVGAGEVPTDERHLVLRSMHRAFQAVGVPIPSVELHCRNTIPHGGGQGSSASAIVSGLLAGRALLPDPGVLTDDDIMQLATAVEGHPDNVAPALLGGFTLAWMDANGTAKAIRRQVHPQVSAVVFTAAAASSTEQARNMLPATVPHADAAANTAAAALLVHALTEDPAYLLEATRDWLHQRYRASAMAPSAGLVADLRKAGIAAVISGAGPSVLALLGPGQRDLELTEFERPGFTAAALPIDQAGARVSLA